MPDLVFAFLGPREIDRDGRASTDLAVDPDVAAALLDDAVDGRHPEPGSLVHRLRREERLEDAPSRLFVHPASGVARSRSSSRARDALPGARGNRTRRERQFRVRIDSRPPRAIASRALTTTLTMTCSIWPRSALTGASSGIEHRLELDVLADETAEHLLQVRDHGVQVHDLRLDDLPPAEREELLRQARGAFAGFPDLVHVGPLPAGLPCRRLEKEIASSRESSSAGC